MKTLKNKLMTVGVALFLVFSLSSFQSVDVEPIEGDLALAKNGEWISAGDEQIGGIWYSVKQCVAGSRVKCVIGSKTYKKKRNQLDVVEGDPVIITRALTNIFLKSISL